MKTAKGTPDRHIVALGGGGFLMEPDNPLLDDFVLSLTRKRQPKVGFLPTASGDSDNGIARFYRAFPSERCFPSHLPLFNGRLPDLTSWSTVQDVIYVGGGNTANMLAVWRVQGTDRALRNAWRKGIVLCGVSAGGMCWFEGGLTDSFGSSLKAMQDGLGFLKGFFCPHYNQPERRRMLGQAISHAELPATYAVEDGCALHFVGSRMAEAVASRPEARAYRVERRRTGIVKKPLKVQFLGRRSRR
jgi:dipeptidase E